MKKEISRALLLFCCCSFSACSVSRITTTEYTAVEQALISSASKKAVSTLDLPEINGKKVFVKSVKSQVALVSTASEIKSGHYVHSEYITSLIEQELLRNGAKLAKNEANSDLIVNILIDYAAIDDSNFILGLPSVPVPVPGVGTIQTPEISLFSKHGQYARAGFTLVAIETPSKTLSFERQTKPTESHYSRWSLLLLLGWRTTDLEEPF